jgi:hypothetical protein
VTASGSGSGRRLSHAEVLDLVAAHREAEAADPAKRRVRPLFDEEEAAVPVLVNWLPRARHPLLANAIVRSLSRSFAKRQARPLLLELFRNPPELFDPERPDEGELLVRVTRGAVASGLAKFADPGVADEYLDLALDRSYGWVRSAIVEDLPKLDEAR